MKHLVFEEFNGSSVEQCVRALIVATLCWSVGL